MPKWRGRGLCINPQCLRTVFFDRYACKKSNFKLHVKEERTYAVLTQSDNLKVNSLSLRIVYPNVNELQPI